MYFFVSFYALRLSIRATRACFIVICRNTNQVHPRWLNHIFLFFLSALLSIRCKAKILQSFEDASCSSFFNILKLMLPHFFYVQVSRENMMRTDGAEFKYKCVFLRKAISPSNISQIWRMKFNIATQKVDTFNKPFSLYFFHVTLRNEKVKNS